MQPDGLRNAAPQWVLTQSTIVVGSTSNTVIAPLDADRWIISFSILGVAPSTCYISTKPITFSGGNPDTGFALSTTPITFVYRDWGGFVGGNWYAMTTSGTVTVQIMKASINPNL